MKIVKRLLSGTFWSLVVLYLSLLAAVRLPQVQQWAGEKVSAIISQAIGTDVTIGHVELGLFNRIIVDDLSIDDLNDETLLHVGRMSVRINPVQLALNHVDISSAQIFGSQLSLYRPDAVSPTNFQFVLDALSSPDSDEPSDMKLSIRSLIVRHTGIRFDQRHLPETPGQFNPNHLNIQDISGHILLRMLSPDSIDASVKRLSLTEQSGLQLNNLTLNLRMGTQESLLDGLTVDLPSTHVAIDSIHATGNLFSPDSPFTFQGTVGNSHISIADLRPLLPQADFTDDIFHVSAAIHGDNSTFCLDAFNLYSENNSIEAEIYGWLRHDRKHIETWKADITELTLASHLVETIGANFLPTTTLLSHIGDVSFSGTAEGQSTGDASLSGHLTTSLGSIEVLSALSDSVYIHAEASATNFKLGPLLDNPALGDLSTNATVDISPHDMTAKGDISRLDYNGYSYENISFTATKANRDITLGATINDPNAAAEIEAEWNPDSQRGSAIAATMHHLAPNRIHLTSEYPETSFSGVLNGHFSGTTLEDIQGALTLQDFLMSDTTGSYSLQQLTLVTGFNDDHTRFASLHGDMGEAHLQGVFRLNTIQSSTLKFLSAYLPSLADQWASSKKMTSKPDFDNNFTFQAQITDSKVFERILSIPLSIHSPLVVNGQYSDEDLQLHLNASSSDFTYDGISYTNALFSANTIADSLKLNIGVTRRPEFSNGTDLSLHADASNDHLHTSLSWDNNNADEPFRGIFNATTQFQKGEQGRYFAHVRILPSTTHMQGSDWFLSPCDILYSGDALVVDHFMLSHEDQHIIVDGIASDSEADALNIDLNDVDVEYVLDLVNFTAVDFGGRATGTATCHALFGHPDASARLKVSDFTFLNGHLGTLNATAFWNNDDQQIDIHAIADEGQDAKTLIDGYVSPVRSDIMLDIKGRGTNIEFLHKFTSSFLDDIEGKAYGDVTLSGPLGEMNLLGRLVVDGKATVTPLGTTYTLSSDTVDFVVNDILLDSIPIHDTYGNVAYFSGGIHHDHLSNATFDLSIATPRLLAYNQADHLGALFYGTVTAEGLVDITGRPGEVTINVNATPLAGSVFTYNAATPDVVNSQNYVTWRSRHATDSVSGETLAESSAIPVNTSTDLYINFFINATSEASVRILMDSRTNDYLTLTGNGSIRANYHDKSPFQMFGTYNVSGGSYGITIQNIIKKNFTIQPEGSLVFGGTPMDAALALKAVHTVNGVSLSDLSIGNSFSSNTVRVNCIMNIEGTASVPRVDFDLDMPTVNSEEKQMIRSIITNDQEMNQQVLYLLGIGRFYTQGINNAQSQQQYGQTELAMQSFLSGTMSTQINEVLSQVLKSNSWNFGANISTGNEGWNNAEYEGLINGQMLNNRLLVNGQFGYRDKVTTASPSFIGDFDLRYLLVPSGNAALKVYNQTNDRYFTRSSLNTQGIGLILKRDFNGLGDLFRRRTTAEKSLSAGQNKPF